MNKRISTGIAGLDTVLTGGFLRHNSILLKGAPGTGKTSMGIQVLLEGIAEGESGIICSFEQFPQQLHRDAKAFGWDLETLEKEEKLAILFLKPSDLVTPTGAPHPPLVSRLREMAEKIGARRLLLDSVSHFNRIAETSSQCRSILLQFINDIKASGITPLLTAEVHFQGGPEFSFEEYLVDEVVMIHNELATTDASLPRRSVEVTKSRGHAHVQGRHPFAFTERGLEVYPHILPEPFNMDELEDGSLDYVASGVKGVDGLLGGGYARGGAVLVAGMSGTYKTTLAGAFLAEGAACDEKGLYITFEEHPRRLLAMLQGRGIDLTDAVRDGKVLIRHYVPKKCCLDQIFAELQEELTKGGLRRVVVDGLGDFERAVDKPEARKDYLSMFLAALTRAKATALFTEKLEQVSSRNPIADIHYVSMVDTVIYLGNVEIESQIRKVISILKSRTGKATSDLREIQCDEKGLRISRKFAGLSGILEGTAHGQLKATIENVFQPLYFMRDFAQMGAGEGVDDAQRKSILENIQSQLNVLDEALKEYFGFDPEEEKKI